MTLTQITRSAAIYYNLNKERPDKKQYERRSWNWEAIYPLASKSNCSKLVCWLPSPMYILKLNFDASVFGNGTFIAYIICNSQGILIRAESKIISQTNVPNVKLIAA